MAININLNNVQSDTEKGQPNGYASLDNTGKVPSSQLPAYTTTDVPEGSNLYFTTARVLATVLTGLTAAAGTPLSTDTILQALGKVKHFIDNISATILGTVLTGFAVGSNTTVTASDTIIQAIAKLQAQVGKQAVISASDVDWSAATHFYKTLSANLTITFSNDTDAQTIIIKLIQGASAYTVTWPSGVQWANTTEPTMSTTAGRHDIYTLVKINGVISGSYVQNLA